MWIVVAFVVSFSITLVVVLVGRAQSFRGSDSDFSQPQKFHAVVVPRVGGLGIFLGLMLGVAAYSVTTSGENGREALLLLVCGLPAFLAGLVEDFTSRVSPRTRFVCIAASAVMAGLLLDVVISRTGLIGLDALVSVSVIAFALTVFAVTGVANSINIIDGFNGLASMVAIMMFGTLAFVAFQVGDNHIGAMALLCVASIFGFFLLNFPAGLVFLGDGGAYFLGFVFAELGILLVLRNASVSPLFPLMVCLYPVFETVFSIYRRRILRSGPTSQPDSIHLHSLIYRRVVRAGNDPDSQVQVQRNSMTSPFLWVLGFVSCLAAVLFWNSSQALLICGLLFCFAYIFLYWQIVRFKVPRIMKLLVDRSLTGRPGDNAEA